MIRFFWDVKFLKFIAVGIVNTLTGLAITFFLLEFLHMGYWKSTSISYVLASILSFYLNKNFTFNYKSGSIYTMFKFAASISICYVLAYGIARSLSINLILILNITALSPHSDRVSVLIGLVLFTILNYLAQKFLVFPVMRDKN